MLSLLILSVSIILQLLATYHVLRLIKITPQKRAWVLIATAVFLMAVRRMITWTRVVNSGFTDLPELTTEVVALFISIIMLLGITYISPLIKIIRDAADQVERSKSDLAMVEKLAHIGNWDWDIVVNEVEWSDEIYRIYGLKVNQFSPTYESFLAIIHPDDREMVQQEVNDALAKIKPFKIEYRVVRPSGEIRIVRELAEITWNEQGEAVRMFGTVQDVTEQKEAQVVLETTESYLQMLYENTTEAIVIVDAQQNITSFNPGAEKIFGYTQEEIIGKSLDILMPKDKTISHHKYVERFGEKSKAKTISGRNTDVSGRRKDGSVFPAETSIIRTNLNGEVVYAAILQDATERVAFEKKLEAQIANLSALHSIDIAITSGSDLTFVLPVIMEYMQNLLQVDAVSILTLDPHTQQFSRVGQLGFKQRPPTINLRMGESYAGQAALKRQLMRLQDLDFQEQGSENFRKFFQAEKFQDYYALPLIARGIVRGVVQVFNMDPLMPDLEWIALFEAMAGQIAIAIEDANLVAGLEQSNAELALAYDTTLEGWSRAMDMRDGEIEGHSQRVTRMAMRLAKKMGMTDEEIVHLRRGALLHDIGKIAVPDDILRKPGPLSDEEWKVMKQHSYNEFQLMMPIKFLRAALDIPHYHHERWDGSGYPQGLVGENIPFSARIFTVVDVWDAMNTDRSYRKALPREEVINYIKEYSGVYFDPAVVEVFLELLANGELE